MRKKKIVINESPKELEQKVNELAQKFQSIGLTIRSGSSADFYDD